MSDTDAVARDEFFESLLGDFLDESGQLLDRLNENLLQLDEWVRALDDDHHERCDDELMNDMFRSAHSLKGLSAMLGLNDINQLTHKVENVFDAARKDELIIDGDTVELMFQAVDRLVGLVDVLKDVDAEPIECESVTNAIATKLQSAGVERKQSTQADAEQALAQETQDEPAAAESEPAPSESAPSEPVQKETAPVASAPEETPLAEAEPVDDLFANIEDEAGASEKYLSIFIDETELSLDDLTETLVAVEGGGTHAELEKLLITSHRIKGSAASVGLNRAAKLAHLMEDLLQELADTNGNLSGEVTDAMLKCADELRQYVENLKQGQCKPDRFSDVARELLKARKGGAGELTPLPSPREASSEEPPEPAREMPATAAEIDEELRARVASVAPIGMNSFVGKIVFQPRLPLVGLKAQLLFEKLSGAGEVCYLDPPVDQLDVVETLDCLAFGLASEKPLETIVPLLRVGGVRTVLVEPLAAESEEPAKAQPQAAPETRGSAPVASPKAETSPAAKAAVPGATPRPGKAKEAASPQKSRPADSGSRPTETLRVDIDRLDQLMNLAGQLVISKARLSQLSDSLKETFANKQGGQALNKVLVTLNQITNANNLHDDKSQLQTELENLRSMARRLQNDLVPVRREVEILARAHGTVNDLAEAVHQLDRVSDGIQQRVMDTRMVPIGPLFTRFRRVIRDITRVNGKEVQLVINGEKTELDKRMIDELSDPLIHMVRNSADHGIELPEVREAAGKPRQGTVTLNAFHRGNSIMIQVIDDGKGLDPERILRKAVDKGVVTEADAERMTPHQIYQLIWAPGLSTAEKVTEVSGRGMGMDIVKSKIEGLNGTIDLDSTPGQGTTLTIKLPLTLAILPSLMVEIEGDVFAMPMESVAEIVGVGNRDLTTIHGKWTARVRGRVISVVRLEEVFTWNRREDKEDASDEELTLVIIGERGHEIGLAVDRVIGEEDVVIKSMAENYKNVPGIAGASILGDGRVSLILDILALIEMASKETTQTLAGPSRESSREPAAC